MTEREAMFYPELAKDDSLANTEKRYAEEHFSIKNQLDSIEKVYLTLR